MEIFEIKIITPQLAESIARLLPQLSANAAIPSIEEMEILLADNNSHLYVAEQDGVVAGMLSLVIVNIPTGRKAWIEDVVVDGGFRGKNIGFELVERAKVEAQNLGAKKLYLTSNPSRKAAHALYKKCGFEEYDTTVFRVAQPIK